MQPKTLIALLAMLAASGIAHAQSMRLVGRSDLGGAGLNGEVTIVGTTATGMQTCGSSTEEFGREPPV